VIGGEAMHVDPCSSLQMSEASANFLRSLSISCVKRLVTALLIRTSASVGVFVMKLLLLAP